MHRGWLPGTGISWAHSSATLTRPASRAPTAGNSDVRSAVEVKIALTTSSGFRPFAAKMVSVSSFAAAMTNARSSASTVIAPRIARNSCKALPPLHGRSLLPRAQPGAPR